MVENLDYFFCIVNCYFLYLDKIRLLVKEIDVFYFKLYLNEFIYIKVFIGIYILNMILFDKLYVKVGLLRKMFYNLRVICVIRLKRGLLERE